MMTNNIVMGRSSSSSNGLFKADTIWQRMIGLITNLCFTLFVIGMVVFTILAARGSISPAIKKNHNILDFHLYATFTEDESVVCTGEDFIVKVQEVQQVETKPISIAEVKEEVKASGENSICDTKTNDFFDHEVGAAMMKFSIEKFQDIKFYGFGKFKDLMKAPVICHGGSALN